MKTKIDAQPRRSLILSLGAGLVAGPAAAAAAEATHPAQAELA